MPEIAIRELRMRHFQAVSRHNAIAEPNDVEIDRPGAPAFAALPSQITLDPQQMIQQIIRFEFSGECDHLVEVRTLARRSDGIGFFD